MYVRNLRFVLGFSFVFGIIVFGFQNCQKQVFTNGKDYSNASLSSLDGNNLIYTNQKNVSVPVSSSSRYMTEMRAALVEDMDTPNIAWVPIGPQITFDLGGEYASDGSKDGIKTVYLEARDDTSNVRTKAQVKVFLDTQVPTLAPVGILAKGIQGFVYKKGSAVTLNWTGADKIAISGESSGIDPSKGLRWGVAVSGDCSENSLTQKSDWMAYQDTTSLPWPGDDPLNAFYICIYAKDRAGNVGTLLSQPMTSVWQVFAGDNNQGNGGSVTAKSVRFGYPTRLSVDSLNNVYVYDAYSNVVRKITPAGIISLSLGNGMAGAITPGLPTEISISVSDMAFDSKDRLYIVGSGAIWRLDLSAAAPQGAAVARWSANLNGSNRIVIDRKTDTMYLSHYSGSASVDSDSYIYKIDIAAVDQSFPSTTRPTLVDFKQKYLFAGNGLGQSSSANFTNPAVVPASGSLDYPGAMAVGDSGELYYSDAANGTGYPFGHHQVRMLKPDANGVLQNYFVTNQVPWHNQMEFIHFTGADGVEQKYLLIATDASGFRKINLARGVLPVAAADVTLVDPYPVSDILHPVRVGGVAAIYQTNTAGQRKLQSLIGAEASNSRLTVLNTDLSLQVNYGRPVYNAADTVATEAMINNPDSVVQAKNGDVYITEPLSHIIRKIDNSGKISLVAGTPGKTGTMADTASVGFDAFAYNGLAFTNGFRYGLTYDPVQDRLFFIDGSTMRIRQMDLATKQVSTYGPAVPKFTAAQDSWAPYSSAIAPANVASRDLIVYRGNPYYPNIGAIVKSYSSTSSQVVAGTGSVGLVATGSALSTALPNFVTGSTIDSRSNYYFTGSGSYGTYKVDGATKVVSKMSSLGGYSVQVVEDASANHLFLGQTSALANVKIAANGTITSTTLCLPGTFLNRAIQIAIATDGNLLIADSKNDRILKYFIRDSSGALKLFDQACKAIP